MPDHTTTATDAARATDAAGGSTVASTTTSASRAPAMLGLTGDWIVCRDCPPEIEQEARRVWSEVRPRIVRHLKRLPHADLRFNVLVGRQRNVYETRLTLALASGTLTARGEGESVGHAVGQATTRLERQLARHLSHLEKVDARRRVERRRSDLESAAPSLAADRARGDQGAFVESLRPYLPRLRELARHEIRIAMLEGRTTPGAVTVSDLLDTVLVRAWEHYDERPKDQPLDTWLVRVLHEVADEMLDERPDPASRLPLDAEQAQSAVSDGEGWVQELEPDWLDRRGIEVADLLPDPSDVGDPDGFVETEELSRLVQEALRGAPATQRRAFVLAAFDGWTEEEIAMLLRRSPDAVRADIAGARERVRQALVARGAAA